ncbi:hypothetical protein NESM_000870700 [Novymonas esmeraldas]|uniref:TIGR04197 family type VII secretion effector n=1 Tax=Novymonas esmeraldas TaxID=1808958 RepID=A0AAW0F117_9TRYP
MRNLSAEASGATATLASNVSGPAGESAQNQGVQSTAQNVQTAASEGQMRHNQLHAVLSDFFSQTRDIATAAIDATQRSEQQVLDANKPYAEDRSRMNAAVDTSQQQFGTTPR